MSISGSLPNFLHLGPSKTGSTWLHEALLLHPGIYLSEAKDLYFFSRYYDRGLAWYANQFRSAQPEHTIVGEVSPEYFACPEAPERIRTCLGREVRLMVTLREPAARAFSSFLYLRKHGQAQPTFRDTAKALPFVLDEGRYHTLLLRYLRYFDHQAIRIGLFDDLDADPQAFLDGTTEWLGLQRRPLEPDALVARLPASKARSLAVSKSVQSVAGWMRRHDGAQLVGHIKRSNLVQRALYRPFGPDRPSISPEDAAFIREQLDSEITGVEKEFDIPLRQLWGWS